jgi:hypothetical protein
MNCVFSVAGSEFLYIIKASVCLQRNTGSFVTWQSECFTAANFSSLYYITDTHGSASTHFCAQSFRPEGWFSAVDHRRSVSQLVGLTGADERPCRRWTEGGMDEIPVVMYDPAYNYGSWFGATRYFMLILLEEKRGGNPNHDCYLDVVRGLTHVLGSDDVSKT